MNLTPRFFRFGAVCAILTALTTLVVHIVPNLWADASTFEQQVALRLNPIYMAQREVILNGSGCISCRSPVCISASGFGKKLSS